MVLSAAVLALLSLFLLTAAQPPRPDGQDSAFFEPLDPPPDVPPVTQAPITTRPPTVQQCFNIKCRTLDGQCTNPANPGWGQSRRAQFSYENGHSSTVATGAGLKSARAISNIIADQRSNTKNKHGLNELFVFFGQFIDHNLVATPTGDEKFDIDVPPGDKFFSGSKLPFKRSMRGLTGQGLNERPINTLSSPFDLVAVYGAVQNRASFLRSGAKMKTSKGNMLPLNKKSFVNAPDTSRRFFLAGDHRANEHMVLLAIHTVFVREHNRLVDLIKSRLPTLGTETTFDYARKLNIAKFQKIVYEEFYPAIIKNKIKTYSGFKTNTNPTVSDIFAGAAFRVGHTLVGGDIKRKRPGGQFLTPINPVDMFFKQAVQPTLNPVELDYALAGATFTSAQELDMMVTDPLRNMLFDNVAGEEGFDLIALNIQRGRDHALPTYNRVRQLFGMTPRTSFGQISSDSSVVSKLSQAYANVNEVEAWPGMMAEDHVSGSGMGPTLERVWNKEFERLRDGDQFFYLRNGAFPTQLFNNFEDVIKDIRDTRKSCFRDLLLRNTGLGVEDLPPNDFLFRPGF